MWRVSDVAGGGGVGGGVQRQGRGHARQRDGFSRFVRSPSVVTLGFRSHQGSSVQQDVSCPLLMRCCKVFDVHYRLKKRGALCILHRCRCVSSSMVLNIASVSKLLEDVRISSFFFPFSQYVLTKKKKKWEKKKEYLAVLFVLICELVCGD